LRGVGDWSMAFAEATPTDPVLASPAGQNLLAALLDLVHRDDRGRRAGLGSGPQRW